LGITQSFDDCEPTARGKRMTTIELTGSETETLMGFVGELLDSKTLGDEARKDLDEVYGKLLTQLIPNLGN
jgi:hypothetical protein